MNAKSLLYATLTDRYISRVKSVIIEPFTGADLPLVRDTTNTDDRNINNNNNNNKHISSSINDHGFDNDDEDDEDERAATAS